MKSISCLISCAGLATPLINILYIKNVMHTENVHTVIEVEKNASVLFQT